MTTPLSRVEQASYLGGVPFRSSFLHTMSHLTCSKDFESMIRASHFHKGGQEHRWASNRDCYNSDAIFKVTDSRWSERPQYITLIAVGLNGNFPLINSTRCQTLTFNTLECDAHAEKKTIFRVFYPLLSHFSHLSHFLTQMNNFKENTALNQKLVRPIKTSCLLLLL